MNHEDSSSKPGGGGQGPATPPADPRDATPGDRRREPVFTDFDEDEDYEESERDTDYASAYEEEDEDELEPLEDDDPDILSLDWQVLGAGPAGAGRSRDTDRNPWAVDDSVEPGDDEGDTDAAWSGPDPELELFEDEDDEEEPDNGDPDDDWDDGEPDPDEFEDELEAETAENAQRWPLGLVIVGLVALALLAAGGYGVIQQRSAAQQEIRQLQATLATAASPAEVTASREALREMEQRAAQSQATIHALTLENRRLTDTVAGLEAQLAAQKSAPAPAARPAPNPPPTTATPKQASTTAGASSAQGGDWFVNFSSYGQRSAADKWLRKLKPSAGKAVVIPGARDGRTFYRVRIVGLADRAQAEKVAAQLQSAHNLPPLWVGSE